MLRKRKMQYVVGKSTEIVTLSKVLPNKLEKNIADRLESSKENSVLETSVTVLADLARDHKNLYKLIYLSNFRSEKSFLEEREKYQTNKLIIKELIEDITLIQRELKVYLREAVCLCTEFVR